MIKKKIISEFISIKPIDVNECWQGRRYRTNLFKKWQELIWHLLPRKKILSGQIAVIIYLYLNSISRSDINDFIKPIIDSIVKKKYLKDDRYITYLEVHKIKSKKEGFKVEIFSM